MAIRLFIAIEIEKRIKERILDFLNHLKKADAGVRWVDSENIHVTLKFLGNIDAIMLPALIKYIDNVMSCFSPFKIQIGNVGAFPTVKKPRILFVGVGDKENNLLKIFEQLEKGIEEYGIKRETKNYVGHITIGRTKSQKNLRKIMDTLQSDSDHFFGQEKVHHISLIQSELTPDGPIYATIKKFQLYENEYRKS